MQVSSSAIQPTARRYAHSSRPVAPGRERPWLAAYPPLQSARQAHDPRLLHESHPQYFADVILLSAGFRKRCPTKFTALAPTITILVFGSRSCHVCV